jgi:hypoxanthine phosphoribosyltransferase
MAEGSWYDADIERVIISEEQIREKTAELAKQVSADHADAADGILLVCVLKGAVMFMADFARALGRHGPSTEMEFMALFRKPDAVKVAVETKYVGFDIPSEFVVGYGLDFAERYRELPYVGVLKPEVYARS